MPLASAVRRTRPSQPLCRVPRTDRHRRGVGSRRWLSGASRVRDPLWPALARSRGESARNTRPQAIPIGFSCGQRSTVICVLASGSLALIRTTRNRPSQWSCAQRISSPVAIALPALPHSGRRDDSEDRKLTYRHRVPPHGLSRGALSPMLASVHYWDTDIRHLGRGMNVRG